MNKLNRDQRGFSMVELIVVIAIMSIMAGVVGYGFSLTNGKPAEECAKKLTAAIAHGRTTTMGKYRNIITVRKETDGRLTVTEDTLVRIEDDGSEVWSSRGSTVGVKGVEVEYKIGADAYKPFDENVSAIQLRYNSGSGVMKKEVKTGKISDIDFETKELNTSLIEEYCTGFRISRAGKVWYVKLETLTGRITSSTTET